MERNFIPGRVRPRVSPSTGLDYLDDDIWAFQGDQISMRFGLELMLQWVQAFVSVGVW